MPGLVHPIKYWEVMNEVTPRHWGGEVLSFFNGTAEEYLTILKITYEAIKESDPEAKVLNAGIADMTIGNESGVIECKDFYSEVFELGGADYFDIANIHWIYNLDAFKEFLQYHGIEKPIWITEAEFAHEGMGKDVEESVKDIVESFAKGMEKIIIVPPTGEWVADSSIFYALKTMIEKLNYFDYVEKINDNCYKFVGEGVTYVIWNSSLPEEINLSEMNVIDVFGNPVELDNNYVSGLVYISELKEEKELGDLNDDGKIDVLDLVALTNVILGKKEVEEIKADINGDGKVDTADLTELINIILMQSEQPEQEQLEEEQQEKPEVQPEEEVKLEDIIKSIEVIFTNSSYESVTGEKPAGWFKTGQNADNVLGWFDFNYTEPLMFNHPMGISTDGKHLLLADTRNNRILIWNELPDGNVPPDLVLGQPDFYSNNPGNGMNELNWPVDVATDGRHVVVADTNNARILIWDEFPTKNGEPADIYIEEFNFNGEPKRIAPWAVYIVDGKLIATATADSKVYIWNEIPKENNTPPDIMLTANGMFGTPREIWSDGERLVIGDHNAKFNCEDSENCFGTVSGTFVWKEFPTADEPYDFFIEGVIWGPAMTSDGKFLMLNYYGLAVWNSFPKDESDEPDFIVGTPDIGEWERRKAYRFDDGDGSSIAVAGDRIYIRSTTQTT